MDKCKCTRLNILREVLLKKTLVKKFPTSLNYKKEEEKGGRHRSQARFNSLIGSKEEAILITTPIKIKTLNV